MKGLYQFLLPVRSNNGAISYEKARIAWEKLALTNAGGFTYLGQHQGVWQSPTAVAVRDDIHLYQVLCDQAAAHLLYGEAFKLFPDQEAFLLAEIGSGDIWGREEYAAHVEPFVSEASRVTLPEGGRYEVGRGTEPNPRYNPNPEAGTWDVSQSVSHQLRAYERLIRETLWSLDAARSAIRKDAVGYRTHNAANLDGGANGKPGQHEAALIVAEKLLAKLVETDII